MTAGIELQHPVRFALLLGAALLTGFIVLRGPSTEDPTAPRARLGLGYYVKGARLLGTGPDGQILYRVTTTAAEQQLADGTITMRDVNVDYVPAAEVPWKLQADRGQIPPDRNIIELMGNVVASTEATAFGPAAAGAEGRSTAAPLLIRTGSLHRQN
jgi:lipopolysaccharide export system protein LptC